MKTRPLLTLCASLTAMSGALIGCRESEPPTAKPSRALAPSAVVTVQSPAQVATALQRLYAGRDFNRLGELIVAERRAETLDLLRAIAEVVDANAAVQQAAGTAYGESVIPVSWDLAAMENNLGVFSARTRLISQRLKGEEAVVTLQEGDHVPLVRAEFVMVSGQWRHRPEQAPRAMVPELRELARVLRAIGHEVRGGAAIETYFDAFADRVFPQMARVVTVRAGSCETAMDENRAD